VDRGTLDRVTEGGLRVLAGADVLAGRLEQAKPAADVDRGLPHLAVSIDRARAKRLRQRLELGRPALAAGEVEPVEDEPGVEVGCDLRQLAGDRLDFEAHRLGRRRPAQVWERLGERRAGELVVA
jgi:hypothetical protein